MKPSETDQKYLLSSVKNALRILHSYTLAEPEKGIRELAGELKLSKSSVQRLMSTLASEGFVTKDPDSQKYRLGTTILALSNIITSHLEIHKEAWPTLEQLVDRTGETAYIGILEGNKLVYMHRCESKRPVRFLVNIGKRIPCYCTSGGKAILAFQESEVVDAIIREGLVPFTPKTIIDPETLRRQLSDVRREGYAVSIGEFVEEEEFVSIGSPIRDFMGNVFASIFIVGPSYRIKPKTVPDIAREVINAAAEVSSNLGYRSMNR